MSSKDRKTAERMHRFSGLSYDVCANIISAISRKDYTSLAKSVEKHLLTGDQSEQLKDFGLTVFDILLGSYDEVASGIVQNIFDDWNQRFGTTVFTGVVEG